MNINLLVIRVIHIHIVLFMTVVPFVVKDPRLLVVHVLCSVTILFHWLVNNDVCALTLLEMVISNKDKESSFMNSIISPIYSEPDEGLVKVICYMFLIISSISTAYYLGTIKFSTSTILNNVK